MSSWSRHGAYGVFLVLITGTILTGETPQNLQFCPEIVALPFNVYYWFRVIFVQLVPCSILVVLNALLVRTMRQAARRRRQLLAQNRKSECRTSRVGAPVNGRPATLSDNGSCSHARGDSRCRSRRSEADGRQSTSTNQRITHLCGIDRRENRYRKSGESRPEVETSTPGVEKFASVSS